ncbi:MAG: HDIG domain-containing protein [Clostridia bacterium]|nr:HDIG domain-containing protein [Clostridia bacterium]
MVAKKKGRAEKRFAPTVSRLLVGLVMFFVMFTLLSAAITPERYDIQIGQPAPNTIKAAKDVEDIITTEKLRADAANNVRSVYSVDENAKDAVLQTLAGRLEAVKQVANLYLPPEDGKSEVTEAQLSTANQQLSPVEITSDELVALGAAEEKTLDAILTRAQELVTETMDNNLRESEIDASVQKISDTLLRERYSRLLVSVISKAVRASLQPNYFYDEAATENARQAERDKVETVTRIKGEVIVSDGEIVTEAQYEMLKALGMIKESTLDISLYYGVALLIVLLLATGSLYLYLFEEKTFKSLRTLVLICVVCVVEMGASLLVREVTPYLMPSTLALLLLCQLVSRRSAIYLNIVMAMVISLFASTSSGFFNMTMFTVMVNTLTSGTLALLIFKKRQQRTTTLLAGLVMGVSNMICTFAVGLVNNNNLMNVLGMAEWAAGSSILASILCIAIMPLLEWMFNVVTPSKLIELSNPNQPLLRRLLLEAPGTYHHSIIVANLAEAAANEVGANALLARVGAYYHDVGKLKRPGYFKENQMGDNPHDRTDPRVSTAILTAHPRDGAQMAKNERIPDAIVDIIRSHHGDSPVLYFYNKSRQENGDDVNIDDFRYDGPRPASREAAIVMLADTVEAAARSMPNPDADKLNTLIRSLVRQKLEDGQLDHCELTFADLDRICSSFLTVLSGVFHERIEYPSVEIPKKQIQAALEAEKKKAQEKAEEKPPEKPQEKPEDEPNRAD